MLNHDEILELCDRYFPGLIFTKDSEPHHVNQIYRAVIEGNDIHFSLYVTDKCAIADVRRQWDKYLHQMFRAIEPTGGVK